MSFQFFRRYRTVVFFLFTLIFCINFATMPRIYYGADANFMRMASINLLNRGALDVPSPPESTSGPKNRGSFLYENEDKEKYFSKYGIMCTLLFSIPLGADKLYNKVVHNQPFFLPPEQFIEKYTHYSKSRVFFLNIFSLLLTLLIAFFLFKIVSFYTSSPFVKGAYILACFYCTFLWYYLRAHSSEVFQLLFFLMFYYFFLKFRNTLSGKGEASPSTAYTNLFYAVVSLLLLCLTKLVYIVLLPILYLYTPFVLYQGDSSIWHYLVNQIRLNFRKYLRFLIFPTVVIFVVIGTVNNYKFGSPFVTGYSQWLEEKELFFPSRIFEGLYGFLISRQKSIFLHFSVLLLSFFGLRKFFKKYTFDTLFSGTIFVSFLLLNSCFLKWHGGHCYGPRYLLFILPVLSMPLVEFLSSFAKTFKKREGENAGLLHGKGTFFLKRVMDKPTGLVPVLGSSVILIYTFSLQVNVNSLNFYTYYHVKDIFRFIKYDKEDVSQQNMLTRINTYFEDRDFGTVAGDLISYKTKKRPFYPIEQIPKKHKDVREYLGELVIMISRYNYFWFGKDTLGTPWRHDD